MKIGYARVSREDQNLERQITALQNEGCEKIFAEKMSGGYKNRPELDKMLAVLVPGDMVVIQKFDRLGRDIVNLLNMLKDFKDRGIEVKSIGDSFDTNTSLGKFILLMLVGFAELERDMIRNRVNDGLRQAKLNGKVLGRPEKDYEEELQAYIQVQNKPMEEVIEFLSKVQLSNGKFMRIGRSKYFLLKRKSEERDANAVILQN